MVQFFIFITLFAILFLIYHAGNFLVVNEKPVKSDVILILSGGPGRLETGASLYKQGFAPYILISNGAEDSLYEAALKLGIPDEAIVLETEASSTTENAIFSRRIMEKRGFQSALVVSSNYHMRRVYNNFEKVFEGSTLQLTYYAVNATSVYDPKLWWRSKTGRYTTITEYIKIVGNCFGIHGEKAKKWL